MTLPEQYAHDYRDMAMSEEELRKMLEEFADEIRKERVNHCDDINCPECPKVAYEAGVKAERERVMEWAKGKTLVENPNKLIPTDIHTHNIGYNECLDDIITHLTTQSEDNNKEV